MDGAVIGGEQNGDATSRGLLQHAEKGGSLEPLPRDLTKSDLVARHLIENLRLAAAVGEKIHEGEDESADSLLPDRRSKMAFQLVGVRRGGDLLISHRSRAVEIGEVTLQ